MIVERFVANPWTVCCYSQTRTLNAGGGECSISQDPQSVESVWPDVHLLVVESNSGECSPGGTEYYVVARQTEPADTL